MISKWMVSNFKSIRDETELELAPLTIFAGANSSGKSTFIQSILLIAQTLSNKVGSRSVVLNGAFTSLGQFDDLKSNGGKSDEITIKCVCRPLSGQDNGKLINSDFSSFSTSYFYEMKKKQFKEISCEISFNADRSSPQRDLLQIQPKLFYTKLSFIIRDDNNEEKQIYAYIQDSKEKAPEASDSDDSYVDYEESIKPGLSYDVTLDEDSIAEIKDDFRSAKPNGCILKHFLPSKIIFEIDTIEEDSNTITTVLQGDPRRNIFLRRGIGKDIRLSKEVISALSNFKIHAFRYEEKSKDILKEFLRPFYNGDLTLKDWFEKMQNLPRVDRMRIQQALREREDLFDLIHKVMKDHTNKKTAKNRNIFGCPRSIADASWYLDQFFTASLKYLGPLRDAPKPLYPIAPITNPNDVGIRGEHMASILELHKNKTVSYIPSEQFKGTVVNVKKASVKLEVAVKDWLEYLGVASSVRSVDKGKLGHELKVGLPYSEDMHDLTHVGVGVSQVLPILVMCLLASPDSTMVFEQPELHLHPKVQTLLGDFFLSMSLCQKQCIVETHSEYLIDRIRYRIASDLLGDELNKLTKLYFVEKPEDTSLFREVVINEYGAITDWPEGFFDQSQKEAENILLAAAKKRKARMVKKNA